MVLLMGMVKASMAALAGLIAILTVPTTLHIPLRDAAVHGATRLRVYLGMANMNRGRRQPTDSVIVPPVPQEDPPEPQEAPEEQEPPEEVAELRVSMSSDTAEPVEPPASVSLETSEVGELEVLALSDASETIGSHPSGSLESVEVAVELQEPASPEGAEAQAPPIDLTSNDAAAAVMNPSEDNHPMEDARYCYLLSPLCDSTCPGPSSIVQPAPPGPPSSQQARAAVRFVPPTTDLILVRGNSDWSAPPFWETASFVIPIVVAVLALSRCYSRNNGRTNRATTPESSISSEVAAEIESCEADTDGVDDNAGTTLEQPRGAIAAASVYLDVIVPSPTIRFSPVMENMPYVEESSEPSEDSDRTITPSSSISPATTALPPPESAETAEPQALMLDSQDAGDQLPVTLQDNTDEAAEAGECSCAPRAPSSHSQVETTVPAPVNYGHGGVEYLFVPHFRFDANIGEIGGTALIAETNHSNSSPIPESPSAEREALDTIATSSDVEYAQDASPEANSSLPDVWITLENSESSEEASVVPFNGLEASTVETSSEAPPVGVDVPLVSHEESEGDLTPRPRYVVTGVGQETLRVCDWKLVPPHVGCSAQVVPPSGPVESLATYHADTEQHSVVSTAAYRADSTVGYHPQPAALGIHVGDQSAQSQMHGPLAGPLVPSSRMPYTPMSLDLEASPQLPSSARNEEPLRLGYLEVLDDTTERPLVRPSEPVMEQAAGQLHRSGPGGPRGTSTCTIIDHSPGAIESSQENAAFHLNATQTKFSSHNKIGLGPTDKKPRGI